MTDIMVLGPITSYQPFLENFEIWDGLTNFFPQLELLVESLATCSLSWFPSLRRVS